MIRYRYAGPVQGLTLAEPDRADGAGGLRTVFEDVLVPGRTYALPDHRLVAAMVAAGRLTPTAETATTMPPVDPTTPPEAPADAAPRRRRTPKEL